ncbi:hypothetical protein H4R34_003542, partial [Dimargaris verticillata]
LAGMVTIQGTVQHRPPTASQELAAATSAYLHCAPANDGPNQLVHKDDSAPTSPDIAMHGAND